MAPDNGGSFWDINVAELVTLILIILSAIITCWRAWVGWWPSYRRGHTFSVDPLQPLFLGTGHQDTLRLRFSRSTPIVGHMVAFAESREHLTGVPDAIIRVWDDPAFPWPRRVEKGAVLEVPVFLEAKQDWAGFLGVWLSDGSGQSCTHYQPVRVQPQTSELSAGELTASSS